MAVSTTVIDTVARRLRDTANLAYPRAVLIRFVDHAQRLVNAYTKSIITTASFATTALHTVSPLYSTLVTNWTSIEAIRLDGKTLHRIEPWTDLVHQDPEWFGTIGKRYVAWATIGKDLLVLYPLVTPLLIGGTLQVDYVPAKPAIIVDDGITVDILLPNELVPVLEDLVEVLGLLKGRRFSEASDPIARFQQTLDMVAAPYLKQDVQGLV